MSTDLSKPTLVSADSTRSALYAKLILWSITALIVIFIIWRFVAQHVENEARFQLLLKSAVPFEQRFVAALATGKSDELQGYLLNRLGTRWTPDALTKLLAEYPELRRAKTPLGFSFTGHFGVNFLSIFGLGSEGDGAVYIFRHQLYGADRKPSAELRVWVGLEGEQPKVKQMAIGDKTLVGP